MVISHPYIVRILPLFAVGAQVLVGSRQVVGLLLIIAHIGEVYVCHTTHRQYHNKSKNDAQVERDVDIAAHIVVPLYTQVEILFAEWPVALEPRTACPQALLGTLVHCRALRAGTIGIPRCAVVEGTGCHGFSLVAGIVADGAVTLVGLHAELAAGLGQVPQGRNCRCK